MVRALFELALRLLPRDFDAVDRAAMRATFSERCNDITRAGGSIVARAWFGLREIGSLTRIILFHRPSLFTEQDRTSMSGIMIGELRHAVRRLLRTPAFTIAALATLAVAIGANTAIFTLLERVVLAPLPYKASDRLVWIDHTAPGVKLLSELGTSHGLFNEYAKLPIVEAASLYNVGSVTITGTGQPEEVDELDAMPSLSTVLSVRPLIGRWFEEAEAREGAADVAVLTYPFWQRTFGGDRGIIGKTIHIAGLPHTVIGVMPRGFAFPDDKPQVILPIRDDSKQFGGFNYRAIVRVTPGTTMEMLRREQDRIIADLPARFPDEVKLTTAMADAKLGGLSVLFRDRVLSGVAETFWILLAAVGIVLLIACANLANLFMVRADARNRDIAVRMAMGAGTRTIAAYYLSESVVIGIIGGLLGLAIAAVSIRLLIVNGPIAIPRLHEIHMDVWSVVFATAISLFAGMLVGAIPMLGHRRNAVATVLQDSGRGNTAGVTRMRARRGLMAAQLALAAVLLVGAALMLQSFNKLNAVDPGFDPEHRLVFSIALPAAGDPSREDAAAAMERTQQRLAGLPGVKAVGFANRLPFFEGGGDPLAVRNRPDGLTKLQAVAMFRRVSPSYFSTMKMNIRAGRSFDATDASGHTNTVVVDQALVDVYFPNEDPIGEQVRPFGSDGGWLTIVGVTNNTPSTSLREKTPSPHMYLPTRTDADDDTPSLHRASFVLETQGDPLALVPQVRSALKGVNSSFAMAQPDRLRDVVARADARMRFTMILLVIAAMVALSLGIVGVYAVIAYAVSQRASEIGVRLALGAQPPQVSSMILRESGPVLVVGIGAGMAAAIAGARMMQAMLFGVAWNDAKTYVAVAALLFMVGVAACWLPASRAARANPLESLR